MDIRKRNKYVVFVYLTYPVLGILMLGLFWVEVSYRFFPCYFSASGAVLVCCALLGELINNLLPWRSDRTLARFLNSDFVVSTIVSKSGASRQLHGYTSEVYSPHRDEVIPSETLVSAFMQVGDLSGQYVHLPLTDLEPIFLLYELADPEHSDSSSETMGTNRNPYIAGTEKSGWLVGETLRKVDVWVAVLITIAAVLGTIIWGYGDLIV